ncbi:MAG: G5 domain-containing protein [Patescibacteria group bacterium]
MKKRILSTTLLLGTIFINFYKPVNHNVLGATTTMSTPEITSNVTKIQTTTAFDQKEIIEYEDIPYETTYEKTDELEYGTEERIKEGKTGLKTKTYLLTYWQEETIDKQLKKTEIEDPTTEVIAKGTKIVWRLLPTPDLGRVRYWHKLDVWATKYDANCIGCTGRTYSGTEVKKGVCATDPTVIPLGTNMYIPGYGFCRAEDIGGAIKGNKIDLGYENAAQGDWRTGPAEVYLLTNAPE